MACRGNVLLSVFETQTTYLRGNAVKYCSLSNGKNNIFLYIRQGDILEYISDKTRWLCMNDTKWRKEKQVPRAGMVIMSFFINKELTYKTTCRYQQTTSNSRIESYQISTMVTRTSGGWVWKVGTWSNRDENDYTLEIDKAQHYFYHIQFHLIYCFL